MILIRFGLVRWILIRLGSWLILIRFGLVDFDKVRLVDFDEVRLILVRSG